MGTTDLGIRNEDLLVKRVCQTTAERTKMGRARRWEEKDEQ